MANITSYLFNQTTPHLTFEQEVSKAWLQLATNMQVGILFLCFTAGIYYIIKAAYWLRTLQRTEWNEEEE